MEKNEMDDTEMMQMIRQAVLFENTELLSDLLKENPWSIRKVDKHGRNLLMLAAHNGRTKALQELIAFAPDALDAQGGGGKTALHLATEAAQAESASILLEAGADPSLRDSSAHCALESAQMAGHDHLTQLLIHAIQSENEKLMKDREELFRACIHGDLEKVTSVIAGCPTRHLDSFFNGREAEDQLVLFVACQNGRFEIVKKLLEWKDKHTIVHSITKDTVVHAAIAGRNVDLLRLVLLNFPDLIGEVNADGSSVLHWIAHTGDVNIAKCLFEFPLDKKYTKIIENNKGNKYRFMVDANAMDGQCRTALYTAVVDGHQEMSEFLLQYQVEFTDGTIGCPFQVDVYCIRGRTPLMIAAFNQSVGLIQLLLQHDADVNLPLGVLEDSEQSLESARCVGSGALAEAARSGGLHVVQLLLQNGAVDTDNRALSIAAQTNNEKIVRVLLCRLAHADVEYKVNKRNVDVGQVRVGESLLPSSLCPSKGASLSWASASLAAVLPDWFVAAALHVNPRLKTTRLALAAITRVDLSCNRLTVFPSVLMQMVSLRSLNLSQNQLKTIEPPSYATSSHSIEILILSNNKIEALSSQLLAALPALTNLDLSHNRITHLPEYIWLSPALKELNVAHNSLTALPSLNNRTRLSRTANVGQISDGFVAGTELDEATQQGERLELRRANIWMGEIPLCKVEEEPSDVPISSSGTLTTLNLQANKLSVFPSCLACVCPRLLSLNLSFNLLTQLTPIQCIPAHLRSLDVSHNRLKELFSDGAPHLAACQAPPLPTEMRYAQLPGRRRSPNRRDQRSRSKSAVRSQRSLSVSRGDGNGGTGINVISPKGKATNWEEDACAHKRHDSLQWCKTFNVAGNELKRLDLWSSHSLPLLPALSVLDASDNHLAALPPLIGHIATLAVLNLNGNVPLETLPAEIGLLSRLWSLSLKNCCLKEPLNSMVNVEQCKTVQLVAFLKSILEQAKAYRHLRLIFLGAPASGRTTLWEAIRSEGASKRPVFIAESLKIAEFKLESKKVKGEQLYGPVTFHAIDFTCDKRELHAVQPYAMSRRAVFIVVFKISDCDEGVEQAERMLVSIQARAPNACVVVVGTHRDQIAQNADRIPAGFLEELENRCRQRWLTADADKKGLPKVIDVLLVSSKSKASMKMLTQSILRAAWESRMGRERLLDAPVPSTHVHMIKVIHELNAERRDGESSIHPLMSGDELRGRVEERMRNKMGQVFRDDGEFQAAVSFLHDCGEIVHYEDASLRSTYCIDPIYLLDAICACVRVRPPSGPAAIILPEQLGNVFKSFQFDRALHRVFLMNVLHKFEVALVCSSPLLLVPCLLPDEYMLRSEFPSRTVKVLVRGCAWRLRSAQIGPDLTPQHSQLARAAESGYEPLTSESKSSSAGAVVHFTYSRSIRFRRLISLAYMPAGFWPRLITRIIGDSSVCRVVSQLFSSQDPTSTPSVIPALKGRILPEWMLWETGIELLIKGHSIFILKQFLPNAEVRDVHYAQSDWSIQQETQWRSSGIASKPIVEMLIASLSMTVVLEASNRVEICMDETAAASLLALITDLVDTLLEDWYPSLGTRFVHSSAGDLLVQRLIPCMHCAGDEIRSREASHDDFDLPGQTRKTSGLRSRTMHDLRTSKKYYAYMIEECIAASRRGAWVDCPQHGQISTRLLAPDLHFADLEGSLLIASEAMRQSRLLGRGAFGFVFRSTLRTKGGEIVDAAVKMLEPVDPGQSRGSAAQAYRAALAKWERDEGENACKAYCTCRQELFLLVRMRHPSVLSLLGVSFSPLSLVVELAPLGALDQLLASYRKSGCRLGLPVLADALMQVAKALEYLHHQHIIYRDLKSENVLAWRFPPPFSNLLEVLVKLGDYGISRSILPSGGAKGFGGTEGFMAPEIVRFNGEEEYTQQVDSFSFGMFMYELLSLRLPFDGEDHVKERLLDGARPFLLPHELLVPSLMLDTMVLCWRSTPSLRPSSSHLVSLVSSPEFPRLLDALQLPFPASPQQISSLVTSDDWDEEELDAEIWMIFNGTIQALSCTQFGWTEHRRVVPEAQPDWLLRGAEATSMWSINQLGLLTVFAPSLHQSANVELPVDGEKVVCRPCLLPADLLCLPCSGSLNLIRVDESLSISLLSRHPSQSVIKAVIALNIEDARQVWTGHDDGVIQAHTIASDHRFSFASSLSHPEAQGSIDLLETDSAHKNVWAASRHACRVFCWDVARRVVVSIFNIRKVVPGWDSVSPSFTAQLSTSTVTSMALLDRGSASTLFIGTTAGVLIAANAQTLQPVLACRPYEGALTSLTIIENNRWNDEVTRRRTSIHTSDSIGSLNWMRDRVSETVDRIKGGYAGSSMPTLSQQLPNSSRAPAVLVSFGTKYRSATERVCGSESAPPIAHHSLTDQTTAIIWRADDWLP
ncbi:unnamed protein product, partial [Mesorhabditis belari]|uniref:Non-specific serine/threonine protein kinase n=1 Tax=Mesorhabditis belari TaxID=2138241 RepID=A0AAF3J3K5_9BILA